MSIDECLAHENIVEMKAKFVEIIEKAAFIGITAQSLGLKESTIYRWMRGDPEFAAEVRHAQSRHAETLGLIAINKAKEEKDTQLLIFLCKTLGKNLGFDEKAPFVNINIGNSGDFDMSGLSTEKQEQLLALLREAKQKDSIESGKNVPIIENTSTEVPNPPPSDVPTVATGESFDSSAFSGPRVPSEPATYL
jgi:hypothetical protein